MKLYLDNKRYHTLNHELTSLFGTRVFKVSLNGGFSCPNIKHGHGCIFCSSKGSGDFAGNKKDDLITQFYSVKKKLNNKWPDTKYIAYFQANTNTYAPIKVLKEKFEKALVLPNVVGLSIGTRPDCITNECLEYLIDLSKRTYLTIELGLQSMHDKTLKLINRGHDLKCFDDCVKLLRSNNINVVVHIINGLPGESKQMMLDTVRHINGLKVQGIKIHMLHVLKNTPLETYYNKNKFHLLSKEEYVNIVCDQLEILDESVVVHRLTGDAADEDLIAPVWTKKKVCVLNDVDKELKRRGTYQGFKRSILNQVNLIYEKLIKKDDTTVEVSSDTISDVLVLASLSKQVFLFNKQKGVINEIRKTLIKTGVDNVKLINDGHEKMLEYFKGYEGKISLIKFTLNHLSRDDKTMLKTIKQSLKLLNKKGVILITCYDEKENNKIEKILQCLDKENLNHKVYHSISNEGISFLIEIKNSSQLM